jgi:hypothetical protein
MIFEKIGKGPGVRVPGPLPKGEREVDCCVRQAVARNGTRYRFLRYEARIIRAMPIMLRTAAIK